MTAPVGWDAKAALADLPLAPFQGSAWRFHKRKYAAADASGSLRVSGRYNRGLDRFPEEQVWLALYLSLGPEVCIGEILRHISAELLPQLNDFRLTEMWVELSRVLNCRDPSAAGLGLAALCSDSDYNTTRAVAAAAMARGAEGILVPSASLLGDNLILFPSLLRASARLEVINSRDPRLYIER
jgi:RES domain-containing protein